MSYLVKHEIFCYFRGMPELPEVQTTVNGLNQEVRGLKIAEVWTSYNSKFHVGKNNIKNPDYFKLFKKAVVGAKIEKAERVGKNILIRLTGSTSSPQINQTILIHMKMTGHLLYGKYEKGPALWRPEGGAGPLSHSRNQFIRLVFSLSNGKHLAFSDMRKFAKVLFFETAETESLEDLKVLGPNPLSEDFTQKVFEAQIFRKPNWPIKQVLMSQEIIAGIGNIYADEMLWHAGIHPLSKPKKIPKKELVLLFRAMKKVLSQGVALGGASDVDYRNIYGETGRFQETFNAYRLTGEKCKKRSCSGKIERIKVGARSAHFCNVHQIKY